MHVDELYTLCFDVELSYSEPDFWNQRGVEVVKISTFVTFQRVGW
jgi:hypothetical protein